MQNDIFKKITNCRKLQSGQVVIIASLFALFISVSIVSIISSPVVSQLKTNRDFTKAKQSFFVAESGNEDVSYRLKNGMNISSQEVLNLAGGSSITTVNDIDMETKEIFTTGDVDSRFRSTKSRVKLTSGISFNYGLFTGQGGIDMDNNTRINGSVYSNGNIFGASNVMIAGDVYVAIRPATTTDVEWVAYNDDYIFGRYYNGQQRVDAAQSFSPVSPDVYLSKISLYLKKVGSPSNIVVKIAKDKNGKPDDDNIIAGGSISSGLISENYSFVDVGFDLNPELYTNQKYWIVADMTRDDNNYYVWGFDNFDSYLNQTAKYSSNWTTSSFGNVNGDLNFKLWVSDENNNGILQDVIVGDGIGGEFSAYAHTINGCSISGDAYANTFAFSSVEGDVFANNITNCVVGGNAGYNSSHFCNIGGTQTTPIVSPSDPAYLVNPVSEANIETLKSEAISEGVISSGNLVAINNQTIGPGVIEGNLIIGSGMTVYLGGTVYVNGNIEHGAGSNIELDIVYGASGSGAIIADGWIDLGLNSFVNMPRIGNGHLMLVSLAQCDEYYGYSGCDDDDSSIYVRNNAQADILVAPYGTIKLDNNIKVVSLVGDKLDLNNNIILNYEQGLTNMNFSSGPSGSWSIESWREE